MVANMENAPMLIHIRRGPPPHPHTMALGGRCRSATRNLLLYLYCVHRYALDTAKHVDVDLISTTLGGAPIDRVTTSRHASWHDGESALAHSVICLLDPAIRRTSITTVHMLVHISAGAGTLISADIY